MIAIYIVYFVLGLAVGIALDRWLIQIISERRGHGNK
jgi:hypothetical protein